MQVIKCDTCGVIYKPETYPKGERACGECERIMKFSIWKHLIRIIKFQIDRGLQWHEHEIYHKPKPISKQDDKAK